MSRKQQLATINVPIAPGVMRTCPDFCGHMSRFLRESGKRVPKACPAPLKTPDVCPVTRKRSSDGAGVINTVPSWPGVISACTDTRPDRSGYTPNSAGIIDVCPDATISPTCVPIPIDAYSRAREYHSDGVGVIDACPNINLDCSGCYQYTPRTLRESSTHVPIPDFIDNFRSYSQ